jgi:hypothetical protein
MSSLTAAFLAELVIITYRNIKQGNTAKYPLPMPLPADYAAGIIVYGGLGIFAHVSDDAAKLAGLVGWGLVVATAMNLFAKTSTGAPATNPATGAPIVAGTAAQQQAQAASASNYSKLGLA